MTEPELFSLAFRSLEHRKDKACCATGRKGSCPSQAECENRGCAKLFMRLGIERPADLFALSPA